MLLVHMLDKKGITYLVTEIIFFRDEGYVLNLPTKEKCKKDGPLG